MWLLLATCGRPQVGEAGEDLTSSSLQKIDSICAKELSFDVTGPYYQSCRNYLRQHVRSQPIVVHFDGPPEHRACEQIGLARDTPDFWRCVQELYQLDVSADHL